MRLQSQPATVPLRYAGPLDCFRQALRAGGAASLYRGVSAPLLGAAVETSSLFVTYRLAQVALQKTLCRNYHADDGASAENGGLPLRALVLAGAASGGATSLLLTPIELVKCQMQAPPGPAGATGALAAGYYRSPLAVVAEVYRHHGWRGFWRGQLGTLIRETGGSAAWFGSYEGVCALFRRARRAPDADAYAAAPRAGTAAAATSVSANAALPMWQQLLAGASAGVSYNFVFYPADTIKSRMQTERVAPRLAGAGRRPTFAAVGRALWRQQGLRGLYQGCGITVGRSAPSSAFIFAVYEGLKGWFG